MNYRKYAHEVVQELSRSLRKVDLSEIAVYGQCCASCGLMRNAVQVTLTYAPQDGGAFQGTGIAYRNINDAPDDSYAYRIARGRAELSLGMQMMAATFRDCDATQAIVQGVHRLPGDLSWRKIKRRRSKLQESITVSLTILDDRDVLSVAQQLERAP